MDGIHGAVLSVKLRYLSEWNEARRKNARIYNDSLADLDGIISPQEVDYAKHVYHVYAIRVQKRDALINALMDKHIRCGIHYPVPLNLQEAYHFLELQKSSFPVAEKCAEELISLPMFPELNDGQIEHVAHEIERFYAYALNFGLEPTILAKKQAQMTKAKCQIKSGRPMSKIPVVL